MDAFGDLRNLCWFVRNSRAGEVRDRYIACLAREIEFLQIEGHDTVRIVEQLVELLCYSRTLIG